MSKKEGKSKSSDAEEVRDILEAVQETIPSLISQLVQSIYSPEVAENIGKSVGTLYQSLKKQGLPDEMVLEMTRNYMKILDIGKLISEGMEKGSQGKDRDIEIEREFRKKLAEKE